MHPCISLCMRRIAAASLVTLIIMLSEARSPPRSLSLSLFPRTHTHIRESCTPAQKQAYRWPGQPAWLARAGALRHSLLYYYVYTLHTPYIIAHHRRRRRVAFMLQLKRVYRRAGGYITIFRAEGKTSPADYEAKGERMRRERARKKGGLMPCTLWHHESDRSWKTRRRRCCERCGYEFAFFFLSFLPSFSMLLVHLAHMSAGFHTYTPFSFSSSFWSVYNRLFFVVARNAAVRRFNAAKLSVRSAASLSPALTQ